MKNRLVRTSDDQLADFAGFVLGVDDFRGGNAKSGFHIAAFAHPFVVVNLTEIAHAGVRQERDDERFGTEVFGDAESGGDTAAAGAAGKKALEFDEAAGEDEALF